MRQAQEVAAQISKAPPMPAGAVTFEQGLPAASSAQRRSPSWWADSNTAHADAAHENTRSTPDASWLDHLLQGARCSWNLARRDASFLVAILEDQGDMQGAVEACRQAVHNDPQNVYAYIHMIDLTGRVFRDLARAKKYFERGLATLEDAADRQLLDAFYLYFRMLNRIRFIPGTGRGPHQRNALRVW